MEQPTQDWSLAGGPTYGLEGAPSKPGLLGWGSSVTFTRNGIPIRSRFFLSVRLDLHHTFFSAGVRARFRGHSTRQRKSGAASLRMTHHKRSTKERGRSLCADGLYLSRRRPLPTPRLRSGQAAFAKRRREEWGSRAISAAILTGSLRQDPLAAFHLHPHSRKRLD